MTIKAFIFVGFFICITSHFIAIAATDAPHNASNNISCGSCHGETIVMNSPFWGTGTYDELCLSCHRRATGGPYSQTDAPAVKTHSDSSESALAECRDCHNPHYQRQKVYKNTDANNLYLATGTITSCSYNAGSEESTLTYSTITYKTATGWNAAKLIGKTDTCRHTILFPHVNKLGYNYPIIGVNEGAKTITVKGDACVFPPPTTFAAMYGQYIRDIIVVDGTNKTVKFFDQTGTNSFADGDTTYNGVCEVCHTQTEHYRNNGGAPDQNHANLCSGEKDRTNCITCHKHIDGLGHGYKNNCADCHGHDNGWNGGTYYGTTQGHSTHTENDSDDLKGPNITCGDCHDINKFPYFKTGTDNNGDGKYDLSETDVCNTCHSPNGTYNGVSDPVIGAKNNWCQGVYQGNDLKFGKGKWCAGCHDENPSNSKVDGSGINAPNVIGRETENTPYGTGYGFYKTGHGLPKYESYPASGAIGAAANCTDCHDVTRAHFDHEHRTYQKSLDNYQAGYRLKYSMDIPRNDTGMPESDFELCGQCHDLDLFLEKTNLATNLRSVVTSGTSTGLSETMLTDTTKAWGDLSGSVLIPNIEKPWNAYPISSNTATTITVSGSMLSDGALAGDSYRVDVNSHRTHLQSWQTGPWSGNKWDSDYDGGGFDSKISCPTCHNVHGSKLARMTRDGTLVSGWSLGFYYVPPYSYPNSTKLPDSDGGRWSQSVCGPCHSSSGTYSRVVKETVTLFSDADQYFSVADPPTPISTITITDNPQTASITAANDIRIRIPEKFNMTWDITDTSADFGGTASSKVNSTVSFPDNKTLLIDVTGDFAAGDTLIVEGLSFTDFSAISDPDNLELYIDGGHVLNTEDTKTVLIGTKALMSSAADQTFAIGDWSTAISPVTIRAITNDADINSTNDIRIRIPSTFPMVWDTTDTSAEISGSAAAKVSATVSFPDERTLLVNVLNDFSEGDEITISGLEFKNFYVTASADNLELYVDGAGDVTADALDDKTIMIESRHWISPVDDVRGYCSEEMSCYETLIDGDLTTGNLNPGRNGIFDLGREYLVTHIRIYAQYDNKWRVYVGNTPTDCLSDGTDVTGQWRIGHEGAKWYEKAVTQVSGRYLRLMWNDVGPYPADNTLLELEFLGIPQDGSSVRMSSNADQEFEVGQAATAVSQITITESSPAPTITASNDIRIVIPFSLYMSWDTSDTVATIGGTASGKVSSTVSYPDDKTLLIDVTSNFAAVDTLTIEGLSFKNFVGQSDALNLGLSVNGGTSLATTDPKTIQIWDWITPVDVQEANPDCSDLSSAGLLIDNNISTGNTPGGGGYALVDLGDTYTVTGIRIFSASLYFFNWDVSIGNDTTNCTLNSYGTMVKNEWYVPGDSQWHSTKIDPPVTGRYIRIDKDQGGNLDVSGLREIDFQGYKTSESKYLTIASSADQRFEKDQAATTIQPINIKYHPTNGTITAANDIRIKIPASFNMTWDTTDTSAIFGGSAASKVTSTVSYPDNKTLLINVTQDFSAGDTLIISGLSFKNFSDQSFKNHLQISIDGGTTIAATDSKYIWVIHWQTPLSIIPDSAYCTGGCGMTNVIDGNTATGNCWAGGTVIFDLGSTVTVRHIRAWTNISRSWAARVSDDPITVCTAACTPSDCCGCSWPFSKSNWYPATGQWSETPVVPTEGRYMKFYIDAGGAPMASGTFMEFQYQAW